MLETPDHPLVVVAGPTACGKSSLAVALSRLFDGEILNCDSLQIYRRFDIGTAKLRPEEQQGIPHHMMDIRDPEEVFTAGDYSRIGRAVLTEIRSRGKLPIVAGGTGFYLRALLQGLASGPERDEGLRERLARREERRPGSLHRLLRRFDSRSALRIHPNDRPKLIRAVEICLLRKTPAHAVLEGDRDPLMGFRVLKIVLFPDRDELYRRIDHRVDAMFAAGLLQEVEGILRRGFPPSLKPFESIGYKQALQFLGGELDWKQALFYAKRDTRRYAKRQMTWFRQEPGAIHLRGFGDSPDVVHRAAELVRLSLALP